MKHFRSHTFVVAVMSLTLLRALVAGSVSAQVPQKINYQGYLADSGGTPVNATVQITFAIYDAANGGSAVWRETQTVTVSEGRYSVALGAITPIALTEAKPYWLGVKVGSDAEMTPRKEMAGSLYDVIQGSSSGSADSAWRESNGNIYRENGNVGIGTNAPRETLDVAGKMVADYLYVDSQNTSIEGGQITLRGAGTYPNWEVDVYENRFRLFSKGVEKFTVTADGNVGIGTMDAKSPLHVGGDIRSDGSNIYLNIDDPKNRIYIEAWQGSDGGTFRFDGDFLRFWNPAVGGMVYLRSNGNIGIGTANPSHRLSVNGTIRAKEIVVNTGWADFVFEDDYKLMPLQDVEQHLKTHKHLPDVPSEQEVLEHGVSLGEMQSTLLQKIEELTLHLIEQDKRITALQQENLTLKEELSALKQAR